MAGSLRRPVASRSAIRGAGKPVTPQTSKASPHNGCAARACREGQWPAGPALARRSDEILARELPEMASTASTLEKLEASGRGNVDIRDSQVGAFEVCARFSTDMKPRCRILPQRAREHARENPLQHICVSTDAADATRRKEERGPGRSGARKRARHLVIVVERAEARHVVEASGMGETLAACSRF